MLSQNTHVADDDDGIDVDKQAQFSLRRPPLHIPYCTSIATQLHGVTKQTEQLSSNCFVTLTTKLSSASSHNKRELHHHYGEDLSVTLMTKDLPFITLMMVISSKFSYIRA